MSLSARITRRIWKRVFSHVAVALPVLVGLTAVAASVVMRIPQAFPVAFVCLTFGAVSAAMRYQRWGAVFASEESDKLQAELQRQSGGTLIDLKAALQLDRNPQGVEDVDKLRLLSDRLERGKRSAGFTVPPELVPTLDALRDACTDLLRQSVRLGSVRRELSTPEAREQVIQLRAALIVDAREAIDQLGRSLDQLQLRALRNHSADHELAAIRDELDTQLNVARAVEQRLDDLERSLAPISRERSPHPT